MDFINKIIPSDCIAGMKNLPDESVNCCVTSPPYWNLRNYNVDGQIGLETTPEGYISKMVEVFREVRRVLKADGTAWINIGDSYVNNPIPGGGDPTIGKRNIGQSEYRPSIVHGLKSKNLIGIPWMLAFALRSDGWILRQDIIWSKKNPMPESVTDRCTKSHEYIFLLSRSAKYYYDQESILEPVSQNTHMRLSQNVAKQIGSHRANGGGKTNGPMKAVGRKAKMGVAGEVKHNSSFDSSACLPVEERNKRSVWTVTTRGCSEAHFATYPEELIVDCIKAGCPEGGIVLDPFMGAGTTALVARKLNRNFVGFELNPDYIKIAENRLRNELGLFI